MRLHYGQEMIGHDRIGKEKKRREEREEEVLFPEKTKIKVTKVKRIENNAPESWAKRGIPKTYATFIEGEIL